MSRAKIKEVRNKRRRDRRRVGDGPYLRDEALAPQPKLEVVDDAERERRKILRAENTPMIDRYRQVGSIGPEQHRAAERFWLDFKLSGADPHARGFNETGGGAFGSKTLCCGPRFAEYSAALRAVGVVLGQVLRWVVVENRSAKSWADACGKPEKHGIAALCLALDALALHYGMVQAKELERV